MEPRASPSPGRATSSGAGERKTEVGLFCEAGEHFVVSVPNKAIALARILLQPSPINNFHPTSAVFDQATRLQCSGRHGHRCSPDPEHLREKLLCQREAIVVTSISRLQ